MGRKRRLLFRCEARHRKGHTERGFLLGRRIGKRGWGAGGERKIRNRRCLRNLRSPRKNRRRLGGRRWGWRWGWRFGGGRNGGTLGAELLFKAALLLGERVFQPIFKTKIDESERQSDKKTPNRRNRAKRDQKIHNNSPKKRGQWDKEDTFSLFILIGSLSFVNVFIQKKRWLT